MQLPVVRPTVSTLPSCAALAPPRGAEFACARQDNGDGEFYFNPAAVSAADLAACEFMGAFLARALLDSSAPARVERLHHITLGDFRLCDTFYKVLLGTPLTLADVADVSRSQHRALCEIHDGPLPSWGVGNFEHHVAAALVLPLRPGGCSMPVTNANKGEFVLLKAQCMLLHSVSRQLDAACAGFYSLCPPAVLRASGLTPRQLRRLLCGGGVGFEVPELRQLTHYGRPFSAVHPVIAWLWEVLAEEGPEFQSAFLEFCTASSVPPAGGFAALGGDSAPLRIVAALLTREPGGVARLPTSHTCISQLDLPAYENKEQLREKLRVALAHKSGYGFA
jgi:E3 ubiquitin-protein ligase HUWE1